MFKNSHVLNLMYVLKGKIYYRGTMQKYYNLWIACSNSMHRSAILLCKAAAFTFTSGQIRVINSGIFQLSGSFFLRQRLLGKCV